MKDSPFHIDYVFVPRPWVERIRAVEVGDYQTWKGLSDHRPVMVELSLDSYSPSSK